MKIKLSKSQWQNIGKKAGWIKQAQPITDEFPIKTEEYKGFNISAYNARIKGEFYCRVDGVLIPSSGYGRWGRLGVSVAIDNAKEQIDQAIAKSDHPTSKEKILEILGRPYNFKEEYAPGQTPYTKEELTKVHKMVGDAAKEDLGENFDVGLK